jgi:coatomer subunit beta'
MTGQSSKLWKSALLGWITHSDIRVWDYTTKSLIASLEGHTSNVSFAIYHPELPIIISGSEDGTIRMWHANSEYCICSLKFRSYLTCTCVAYRFEQSLNYGLERCWCVAYQRGKQGIAVGFDDGAVVVKLGREEPAVSMDGSGKLIWARHNEIVSSIIKGGGAYQMICLVVFLLLTTGLDTSIKDNVPITLPTKDLGTCEIYPQTLIHSPNGRFVAVCGDGECMLI